MAKDPYRYFRVEAPELIEKLTQGVLALEKGASTAEAVSHVLRLAHTLKGAARVVRQSELAELAHKIEGRLTGYEATTALPATTANEVLRWLDRATELVQRLDAPAVAVESGNTGERRALGPADDATSSARIELRELDALLQAVAETAGHAGSVRRSFDATVRARDLARVVSDALAPELSGAAGAAQSRMRAYSLAEELRASLNQLARTLHADVERLDGGVAELQETVHRLRLVPAHTVFPALDRAVRDAAQGLDVEVSFEAVGGEVQLDAQVLTAVRDALVQIVRNAVAHGVEPAAERAAHGKTARACIKLVVTRNSNRVSFACQDDGRGVDLEAVRAAAIRNGLTTAANAGSLSDADVLKLLQRRGLTTSARVTELAGRGIGLDVVRATAERLKGEFRLRSEPGRGTFAELQVPVSIALLQALVLQVGEGAPVIPLDAVRQTLRLPSDQIASASGSQSIVFEGQVIPFLPLERVLPSATASRRAPGTWSAVVVRGDSSQVAIGVERLLGTEHVVMRPLPRTVQAEALVAGAYLDAEGTPQLVLDPTGLIALAQRATTPAREVPAQQLGPVLVVDDSLTTRMLEQSILESAGYEVELAVSAEDALEKASQQRHCLFIVDVEMPGIDGFEFVARVRSDPELRDTPAILVTSRNAAEDRRKGEQAGAQAYIVKGEFDQGLLLRTIRRLVG